MEREAATRRRLADAAVAVALLVVAWLVRRSGLGPSSLWLDDAWVALVHRVDALGDVWRMGLTAPGFAILLKAWFATVGFSSTAAQAVPFAAGVLAPAGTYLVGRRLGLRPVPALTAGVLLALAPAHATYSVRVKQYSLDALLVVVVTWLAVRAAERPDDRGPWAALACGGAVATVVSTAVLPAVAVLAVAGLVPGLRERLRARPGRLAAVVRWPAVRWVAGYLGFAVAWGTWMVAARLSDQLGAYWEGFYVERWSDLGRVAGAFVEGLTGDTGGPVTTVLVAVWLLGGVVAVRRAPRDAAILWGPVAAALLLAALGAAPLGTGRTELYLYPVVALGLAWSIDRLVRLVPGTVPGALAAAAVLGLLVAVVVPVEEVRYPQQDLRPLVAIVEERLQPTDRVLVSPSAQYATALYGPWTTSVQPNRTALGFAPRFSEPVTVVRHRGTADHLTRTLGGLPAGARVWLLVSHDGPERMAPAVTSLRELGFVPVEEVTRPGAALTLWVREASAARGGHPADGEQRLADRGAPAALDAA